MALGFDVELRDAERGGLSDSGVRIPPESQIPRDNPPVSRKTFAVGRGKEVFVGIPITLVVGLIIRPRHPLPEFQEILRSICRESGFLVCRDANDPIDSPGETLSNVNRNGCCSGRYCACKVS